MAVQLDEIFARDWLVARGCRDDAGRPFAESKAPVEVLRAVPLQFRQCPYGGSRHMHDRPMNASALRHLAPRWSEIKGIALTIRRIRQSRYGGDARNLTEVLWLSSALVNIQNYLIRRPGPVGDGDLPAAIGGLYKASLGVSGISFLMCLASWLDGRPSPGAVTPDQMHAFAERHHLLIGRTEVCAGPPDLINQLLEVIVHGRGAEERAGALVVGLIGDVNEYLSYATGMLRLELFKHAACIEQHAILMDLARYLAANSAESTSMKHEFDVWMASEESWQTAQSSGGAINRHVGSLDDVPRGLVLDGLEALILRLDDAMSGTWNDSSVDCLSDRAVAEIANAVVRGASRRWPGLSATTALRIEELAGRQLRLDGVVLKRFDTFGGEFAAALHRAESRSYTTLDVRRALGACVLDFLSPTDEPRLRVHG